MQVTIADRIKKLRKSNKLTQSQLGEKLGYSDKVISKWEKGICEPDSQALIKLSNEFNISIDYLLKGDINSSKQSNTQEDIPFDAIGFQFSDVISSAYEKFSKVEILNHINNYDYFECEHLSDRYLRVNLIRTEEFDNTKSYHSLVEKKSNYVQVLELENKRGLKSSFDLNNRPSNISLNAKANRLMYKIVKDSLVPETDAYALSRLASYADREHYGIEQELTPGQFVADLNSLFDIYNKWGVKNDDIAIFVSDTLWRELLLDDEITERCVVTRVENTENHDFDVYKFMGRYIIPVSDYLFLTDVVLNENDGFSYSESSRQINYIACMLGTINQFVVLDFHKFDELDCNEFTLTFGLYHDIFATELGKKTLFCSVGKIVAKS